MGDRQYRHGRPELFSAPGPQGVIAVGCEVGHVGRDHLTLLTKGAGEQVNIVMARGVAGHGQPSGQSLVIGVRVDEQQPYPLVHVLRILRQEATAHRRETVARSTVPKSAWLST